jgi:hypothetical protein
MAHPVFQKACCRCFEPLIICVDVLSLSSSAFPVLGVHGLFMQAPSPEETVGPPLFMANDFVIYDKLGSLNVRTVEESSVLASLDETLRKGTSTVTLSQKVNIYSATYESGKPFQGPVTVLLKEYTPYTRQIGTNELLIADRLQVLHHSLH